MVSPESSGFRFLAAASFRFLWQLFLWTSVSVLTRTLKYECLFVRRGASPILLLVVCGITAEAHHERIPLHTICDIGKMGRFSQGFWRCGILGDRGIIGSAKCGLSKQNGG